MDIMAILIYLGASILGALTLWLFFLAVMALKVARDNGTLPKAAMPFAYIILFVGLFVDFLVNVFVASIIFVEPPFELSVTARVTRHIKESTGWRQKMAKWICQNLLDPFEIGGHCK
jgi:hypothetical protein